MTNLKSWPNLRKMGLCCMKENYQQNYQPSSALRSPRNVHFQVQSLLWSHYSGSRKWFEPQLRTEPFQTVKTVTSTAQGLRFELQPCAEQLLGVHTVTSCIRQPRFELQTSAASFKTVHTFTSQLGGHVDENSVHIRRSI